MLDSVFKEGSKAAFYARYSTSDQNPELQRNAVRELVKTLKCEIISDYIDHATSATRKSMEERTELMRLLEDAKQNKFDFIVVYAKDRLARDVFEHYKIKRKIVKTGKKILIACEQDIYGEKKIVAELLGDAITQYEANNIRRRSTDGKINNANHGKWNGGKEPFGYKYDKTTKEFNQVSEQVSLVKEIFEKYIEGYSCEKISELLPKASYIKGKNWTRARVQSIVTNPFYAGLITWGKKRLENKGLLSPRTEWREKQSSIIVPIISRETWEKAWEIYRKKGDKHWPKRYLSTSYLLSGVLLCPYCNQALNGDDQRTNSNGKTYGKKLYRCKNKACKGKFKIEKDIIEPIIMNEVVQYLKGMNKQLFGKLETIYSDELKKKGAELNSYEEQIDMLNLRVPLVSKKIDRLVEDYKKETDNGQLVTSETLQLKHFIQGLTLYRTNLSNQIKIKEEQIKQCKYAKNRIENVMSKREYWELLLNNFRFEEIETSVQRQLIIELVRSIIVNGNDDVIIKFLFFEKEESEYSPGVNTLKIINGDVDEDLEEIEYKQIELDFEDNGKLYKEVAVKKISVNNTESSFKSINQKQKIDTIKFNLRQPRFNFYNPQ